VDKNWTSPGPQAAGALTECNLELAPALAVDAGGRQRAVGQGSTLPAADRGLLSGFRPHHCPVKAPLVFRTRSTNCWFDCATGPASSLLAEGLDQTQRQTPLAAALAQVGLAGFRAAAAPHSQRRPEAASGTPAPSPVKPGLLLNGKNPPALLDPNRSAGGCLKPDFAAVQPRAPASLTALWITHRARRTRTACDVAPLMTRASGALVKQGR